MDMISTITINPVKFRSIFIKVATNNDEIDENIGHVFAFYCKQFGCMFAFFLDWSGAKVCLSCRSRKMLQNEYLVAKFGFDTAKNEPRQVLHFLAGKLEFNTVVDDRIRQLKKK